MKLRPRALEGGRRQRREGQGKGKGEQNVPVVGLKSAQDASRTMDSVFPALF